ncbi:UDP-D-galactose:(glucosyl)lipopolysaccharide-1,6-D-galactosyltransferase [compost metagenome]
MPSKAEGFGIVFIEALASGLRVIAGNKDGSVDALRGGALGVLVDPDDQQEILTSISPLLGHTQTQQEKKNLQEKCISAFGYNQYLQSIRELLVNGKIDTDQIAVTQNENMNNTRNIYG